MTTNNSNASKQTQMLELKAILERGSSARNRFQKASRQNTYPAFNHPTLQGENWRSQVIERNVKIAEEAISYAIEGNDNIEASSLDFILSRESVLEKAWECVFWMTYCYANAATLDRAIENVRTSIGKETGSYDGINTQSAFLKSKADALRTSWRTSGVAEILIEEIVNQLRQLSSVQIDVTVLDGEQTWARGIAVLTASVEEYENLVERYVQTVEKIVAGLSSEQV